LAANFNSTTLDAITTPSALAAGGYNIFDRQEQGLITNSRPKSKMLLGLSQDWDKWSLELNNTLFGKVTVTAPESGGTDQELSSKMVTDINMSYKFTDKLTLNGNVGNLFDVYPDPTDPATNTSQAGTRFIYSSEVQQMGQLGTNFSLGLNYQF
jgi:iron complex outermembrane receptor protein